MTKLYMAEQAGMKDTCRSILKGSDDGKVQIKLLCFWILCTNTLKRASFRNWICFQSQAKRWKGFYSAGTQMDKVQKPSSLNCNFPQSEKFRIDI